jgi:hypothetical protein
MTRNTSAWLVIVLMVFGLQTASCVPAERTGKAPGDGANVTSSAAAATLATPNFNQYFEYTPLNITSKAPQYSLPLKPSAVTNLEATAAALEIGPQARALLLKQGFVVTDLKLMPGCEDVAAAYKAIGASQCPVLVTSGSLLHVYHILFDNTLSSTEANYLYADVWRVASGLFARCVELGNDSSPEVREAAARCAAYLAVGLSLLAPQENQIPEPRNARGGVILADGQPVREFTAGDLTMYKFDASQVPAAVAGAVSAELNLITQHAGFAASPLFIYEEDYSQYVPRGHYTATEKLKNYFRAMMWFGRMSLLLRGSDAIAPGHTCATCDALVSQYDARIQTLGACILTSALAGDPNLMESWDKAYEVTSFFVGFSDDLGPYQYLEAMNAVFGGHFAPGAFAAKQGDLKAKLAAYRSPRIYGGTGNCVVEPPFTPEQADKCLEKTRGFRLMGQRFVPDSYVMSKLVAPYVGRFTGSGMPFTAFAVPGVGVTRVFPRGLDVMAALGSQRASAILDDLGDSKYEGFAKASADLKQELDALKPADWHQNLYWNWLWVLQAMIGQYGSGFPTFMQSEAWKTRMLTQSLASWMELRHDTILYAKQSYTMMLSGIEEPKAGPPPGYVEPVPEVYARLAALTRMMHKGLVAMEFLNEEQGGRLTRLENALAMLTAISSRELSGEALTINDNAFIADFADVLDKVLGGIDTASKKTTLVADVHTDANSGMVLEEACGHVELLVCIMKNGSGSYAAAGPELSYFEFKQPMSDRLTDEAWRELLNAKPPDRPPWTKVYSSNF